jgi:hypothetical protein
MTWALANPVVSWVVRGFFVGTILGLAVGVALARRFVGEGGSSQGAILLLVQFFTILGLIVGSASGGLVGTILERRRRKAPPGEHLQ